MKTVEKVARALAYSHYSQRFGSYNSEQVKLNVDGNWNAFVDDAIAAIGAMKDPEPKILNAACKALSPGYRPTEDRTHGEGRMTTVKGNEMKIVRDAIKGVMVGGNHLVSIIGSGNMLPYRYSPEEALEIYGAGDRYDAWCCWRSIMLLRDASGLLGKDREYKKTYTPEQAEEIIKMRKEGIMRKAIAKKFGLSERVVGIICKGVSSPVEWRGRKNKGKFSDSFREDRGWD